MKILNWMQSKIQGKPGSAAKSPISLLSSTVILNHHVGKQDYSTAETSDWWPASGLLAIGTLGLNKNLKKQGDDQKYSTISQDNFSTLPLEEMWEMSEKLCSMIEDSDDEQVLGSSDLKQDREDEDYPGDLSGVERSISFALSRGMKSKNVSTKKSLSTLFKKMYAKDFLPSPGLKHPWPESRLDKILRVMLHKKIYPQSSSTKTVKKRLWNKPPTAAEVNDTDSKWIKTDSDYIVLEM